MGYQDLAAVQKKLENNAQKTVIPDLATRRIPALNTYGYIWSHPAEVFVETFARKGHSQFELMVQPGHLDHALSSPQVETVRAMLADGGVSACSLNMPTLDTNMISAFPEMRAYTISALKQNIALAAHLGIPNVVTGPGRLNPLSPAPLHLVRTWLDEAFDAICPFARKNGVTLAVENLPMAALPRAEDLLEFVTGRNDPCLGICYDVANAHYFGEDPAEGLRTVAGRLSLVHFSDTTQKAWRHDTIGQGNVDFTPIRDMLNEIGYSGPIVLEIIGGDPSAAIRESIIRLRAMEYFDSSSCAKFTDPA